MTRARMLYLGGALVDLLYHINHLPGAGTEVTANAAEVSVGGGFNTMVAALRDELPVAYGGAHGTGPYGDNVRQALHETGITLLQQVCQEGDTGTCVVLVTADGERSFVTHAGVEALVTDDRIAAVVPRPDDWLVLSGYALCRGGSDGAVTRWLSRQDPALPLLFDPCPLVAEIPRRSLDAVLRRCTWLSCNAREAATLTGETDPCRAIAALRGTAELDHLGIVVRLGPDGCLLAPAGGAVTQVPAFAVEPLDSTGAGDAHVGVFVAALSRGVAPHQAARRANAAGAMVVARLGGATAPSTEEIDRYLAEAERPAGPATAAASTGR